MSAATALSIGQVVAVAMSRRHSTSSWNCSLTRRSSTSQIAETDNIMDEICAAISHYAEKDGYIHQSLRRADSASTLKDVQGRNLKETGRREYSLSSQFIKATQRLTPTWTYNKPGSMIWVVGGDVYIASPQAIVEIIGAIQDMKVSCPTDVNVVHNLMVEQHIIQSVDAQTRLTYWLPGEFTEDEVRKSSGIWLSLRSMPNGFPSPS